MAKICVIGRCEDVLCYMAAGLEIREADNMTSAAESVDAALHEDCAAIFLSEEFASLAQTHEAEYSSFPTAVMPLPGGVDDIGTALLKKYVERAVGSDIVFSD